MRYDEETISTAAGSEIIFYHSTVPAGDRAFWEHHHTELEISLCSSGSGIYTINGKNITMEKGDIFLFSTDELHCITKINDGEKFDLINIQFEPRLLWSDSEQSELLKIFFQRNENFTNRFENNNPSTRIIAGLMHKIDDELSGRKEHCRIMTKTLLTQILVLLNREFGYVDCRSSAGNYSQTLKQLEKSLMYIDGRLDSELTLDEIAKAAAMNKTYFSTVFKKFNGISPWEYITIKRVEKAVGLLKTTDYTKLDIAMLCGFNSSTNFYKAFKKVTGKSPGAYSR
ncbi:MAG: AraC family transcriptional regulator [Clostridia bacterium]|nr:AraC family transcriptional regulator [Clostridia bacterium]